MTRTEKYERKRPDGSVAVITRDLDTGEKSVEIKGAEVEADTAVVVEVKGADGAQTPPSGDAPERPSRGASLAAWVEFAQAVSFGHAEGASRDEIRDAYEAAHPAE